MEEQKALIFDMKPTVESIPSALVVLDVGVSMAADAAEEEAGVDGVGAVEATVEVTEEPVDKSTVVATEAGPTAVSIAVPAPSPSP
jgi:hypothetical protein